MKLYTSEMFTSAGLERTTLLPIRKQLEIAEYTYDYLLKQIDSVKKNHFKELYIYETMKKENKSLIPNITVLTQYKTLERDPTFLDFKKQLEVSKKEIKNLNYQADRLLETVSGNFSFSEYNLERYLEMAIVFFDTLSEHSLTILMKEICKFELGSSNIYYNLRWGRAYDVYELLLEKAPQEWQSLFNDIFDIILRLDEIFDANFWKTQDKVDLYALLREHKKTYFVETTLKAVS